MPKHMKNNLCVNVNGQSQVPPGFRFHPTEEELLHYYLRKKVAYQKIDLDVIPDVDLNKLEPWDIQEICKIGSTPQNDWYFFSHKDKKYPTGTRTNRATAAGFWKATGRDKVIYSCFTRIGMRKTLVFYKGRAPHGLKSDWIMHEYRLDDNTTTTTSQAMQQASSNLILGDEPTQQQEDGWVVCRVFKKKNYHKATESSPQRSIIMDSSSPRPRPGGGGGGQTQAAANYKVGGGGGGGGGVGVVDQILHYMGSRSNCKQENETITNFIINNHNSNLQFVGNRTTDHDHHEQLLQEATRFFHLPRLDDSPSPNHHIQEVSFKPNCDGGQSVTMTEMHELPIVKDNWVDLDRLVASQLNVATQQGIDDKNLYLCYGESEAEANDHHFSYNFSIDQHSTKPNQVIYGSEIDLWSFARSSPSSSSPDPLCHLSV